MPASQVLGRFYQHFSIFWGKYRFHKWSSYHFIQWCTVQITENDGSFNLISAMQFMCAHCTGCAESTSFAKHWGSSRRRRPRRALPAGSCSSAARHGYGLYSSWPSSTYGFISPCCYTHDGRLNSN